MLRLAVFATVCFGSLANAANINADPSDYLVKFKQLQAGDVLRLAPGQYAGGLPVHGLLGTAEQPIVIRGSGPGKTRLLAKSQRNTISIVDSAHVTIRDLMLDGLGLAADAVRAEGNARWAHHISLENLLIVNHGANQGYVVFPPNALPGTGQFAAIVSLVPARACIWAIRMVVRHSSPA